MPTSRRAVLRISLLAGVAACWGELSHPVAPSTPSAISPGSTVPSSTASPTDDPTLAAADAFSRVLSSGWGQADVGGAWSYSSTNLSIFEVGSGQGRIKAPTTSPLLVTLDAVSVLDGNGLASFSIDRAPDNLSRWHMVEVYARRRELGQYYYRYRVRAHGNGTMDLRLEKRVSGTNTWLTENTQIPVTWKPGALYWVRWDIIGTSPFTELTMRVWRDGDAEPADWQVSTVIDEPALDVAGSTGFRVSPPTTDQVNFPVTFAFDDLKLYDLPPPPPPNTPPVADPGGPYTGEVGEPIAFDGTGSSDADGDLPLTYYWEFGDGATSEEASPSHSYAEAGTYTVTLTVTDSYGLSSEPATTTATVGDTPPPNSAPVAAPGGPYTGKVGEAVVFDGSGSSDPDGDVPLSYHWEFGDGATSDQVTPSHTYTADGTYTVTLTVTDAKGLAGEPATTSATITDPSLLVRDRFSRVISPGWGSTDVGGLWRIDDAVRPNFRVDGSQGHIAVPDIGPRNAVATDGYGMDVAGITSFSIDVAPSTASIFHTVQVYARRDDRVGDGDNYYRYRVRVFGSGTMDLRVEKRVSQMSTFLGGGNKAITTVFAPGKKYWIRWEAVGVSPATMIRMRVWADGSAEPSAWDIELTVNEPGLDRIGTTGFRIQAANGTFPVTFSFDDLEYRLKK